MLKKGIAFLLTLCLFLPVQTFAMPYAITMTHAEEAQEQGLTGEGIVIAIIDSSFSVNQELLVLSDGVSQKLKKEDIMNTLQEGKLYATQNHPTANKASYYVNEKIPFAYDYCGNDFDLFAERDIHGTHVAGIAAANKKGKETLFNGVAPNAQLLLMKISSDGEELSDEAIVQAIEDAVRLGADIINMSLGSEAGFSEDGSYQAALAYAENAGVLVVAAAGNSAMVGIGSIYSDEYDISLPLTTNPDYGLVGSPSSAATTVSVASVQNQMFPQFCFQYGEDGGTEGTICYKNASKSEKILDCLGEKAFSYVPIPNVGAAEDYVGLQVKGKIALVQRGTISFEEKSLHAEENGAIALLVYDNQKDSSEYIIMETGESTFPSIFILEKDGKLLLDAKEKTIFLQKKEIFLENPLKGQMALSSSWGTTPDLKLKPEISAPGDGIYSSAGKNTYDTLGGTSMATPHISGISALLKQYLQANETQFGTIEKEAIPAFIRNWMMTTATPLMNPYTGGEYSPRQQGAGIANITNALKANAFLVSDKTGLSKIELGDQLEDTFSFSVTAHNFSDKSLSYTLDACVMADAYETDKNLGVSFVTGESYLFDKAQIVYEGININKYHKEGKGQQIVLKAGEDTTFSITVTLPARDVSRYNKIFSHGYFLEGFVSLTPQEGSENSSLSIPYMGFHGDWTNAPIFDELHESRLNFFDNQYIFVLKEGTDGLFYPIEMGKNVFIENSKFKADLIAISPNHDDYYDTFYINFPLLRNAKELYTKITDETGKELYCSEDWGKLEKTIFLQTGLLAYWDEIWAGTDWNNTNYVLPDGKYYFTIVAVLDYESAKPQEWSVGFFIDTQKPELVDSKIVEENGAVYLDVTTKDNQAIQATCLYSTAEPVEGEEESYHEIQAIPVEKSSSQATQRYTITDRQDDYLYLEVLDYAYNSATFRIPLNH